MSNSTPDNGPDDGGNSLPAWARNATGSGGGSSMDEQMSLFIGPKWETTYRRKLSPFLDDPSFVPTWNWSAFFATPLWFLYRKLYFPFVVFMFAPGIALNFALGPDVRLPVNADPSDPETMKTALIMFSFTLSGMVAAGGTGNWLLFRRARAVTSFIATQNLPKAELHDLIERFGGVHKWFTTLMAAMFASTILMRACSAGA